MRCRMSSFLFASLETQGQLFGARRSKNVSASIRWKRLQIHLAQISRSDWPKKPGVKHSNDLITVGFFCVIDKEGKVYKIRPR